MNRITTSLVFLLIAIGMSAQTGKITNIKVLGIDKYPTESFLNISVTAKYANIKDEGSIIVYMDDDPQSIPSSTGGAWSMLLKRNHTGTTIPATGAEKTGTFTLKMKLHPERLKGKEVTKYYLRGFMSAKDYEERTDHLFTISEPFAFNINTIKVTNHKNDIAQKQPTAEERKRQEQIVKQSQQETMSFLGGLLGAMIGVADDSACMYCGGEGCAKCNYDGHSRAGIDAFAEGYRIGGEGSNSSSKTVNSTKVLNGYHTKEYSDGTYKGNFRNGKMHGQGTFVSNNGDKYVGNFVDGQACGRGTLTYANGNKYVGNFKDSEPHGKGKFTFANGGSYQGDFENGKFEGEGTCTYSNGDKYIGHYHNGYCHGHGVEHKANGDYIEGIYEQGNLIRGKYKWAAGGTYEGEFKNGVINGKGVKVFSDGTKYEGDFVNGIMQGKGVLTWTNGDKYEGEFSEGLRTGKGIICYTTNMGKESYEGDFVKGKKHGWGVERYPSGDMWVGEFEDGWTKNGTMYWLASHVCQTTKRGEDGKLIRGERGTWTDQEMKAGNRTKKYPNGDTYTGRLVYNVPEGKGIYVWMNGDKYSGEWNHGKRHGKGTFTWANGDSFYGEYIYGERCGKGVMRYRNKKYEYGLWNRDKLINKYDEGKWKKNGDEYEYKSKSEQGPSFLQKAANFLLK